MSQLSVEAWCRFLAPNLDETLLGGFVAEAVQELGRDPRGWMSTHQDTLATAGNALATPPADVARVEAVAADGRMLSEERLATLDLHDPHWRGRRGDPDHYLHEDVSDRFFVLVPTPTRANVLKWFCTQRRGDGLPRDTTARLDLPLALMTLAREFQRESDHRDLPFAHACRALAATLLGALA